MVIHPASMDSYSTEGTKASRMRGFYDWLEAVEMLSSSSTRFSNRYSSVYLQDDLVPGWHNVA